MAEDFKGTLASDLIGKAEVKSESILLSHAAADAGLSLVVTVTIHGTMLDVFSRNCLIFRQPISHTGVSVSPEDQCKRRRRRRSQGSLDQQHLGILFSAPVALWLWADSAGRYQI